ncbi:cation:proton antiporter [soil metagenome]|nr:cation:proton antiporter [Euzebyaceae bacterium]
MELPILVQLFLLFAAAKLAGEVFERLGQPAVIGELLVGMVLGAGVLGVVDVAEEPFLREFAELCVVILLFRVGLETRLSDIRAVGRTAALVAVVGVVIPFGLGYGYYVAIGRESITALFLGAALVATSVGVTARVLADLRLLGERESRIILGAAVIDDILGLIVLSIVAGGGGEGGIDLVQVGVTVALSTAFLVVFGLFGTRAVARGGHLFERPRLPNAPFALAALTCLGVAALAQVIGLAAIVGAFLAGMVMAETPDHYELEEKFEPLGEFLVPFFFVITGATVDPTQFFGGGTLVVVLVVVALAAVGKLVGCGLAAAGLGWRSAVIVGVGMVPRGEVGIIVANAGEKAGAVDAETFAVIVAMSILTTLIVPPVLKVLFADRLAGRRAGRGGSPVPAD